MKVKGKFEFLGITEFKGHKDPTKSYYNANLLQGTDILKVFLQENQFVLFSGLEKMDKIDVEFALVKTLLTLISYRLFPASRLLIRPQRKFHVK